MNGTLVCSPPQGGSLVKWEQSSGPKASEKVSICYQVNSNEKAIWHSLQEVNQSDTTCLELQHLICKLSQRTELERHRNATCSRDLDPLCQWEMFGAIQLFFCFLAMLAISRCCLPFLEPFITSGRGLVPFGDGWITLHRILLVEDNVFRFWMLMDKHLGHLREQEWNWSHHFLWRYECVWNLFLELSSESITQSN